LPRDYARIFKPDECGQAACKNALQDFCAIALGGLRFGALYRVRLAGCVLRLLHSAFLKALLKVLLDHLDFFMENLFI